MRTIDILILFSISTSAKYIYLMYIFLDKYLHTISTFNVNTFFHLTSFEYSFRVGIYNLSCARHPGILIIPMLFIPDICRILVEKLFHSHNIARNRYQNKNVIILNVLL